MAQQERMSAADFRKEVAKGKIGRRTRSPGPKVDYSGALFPMLTAMGLPLPVTEHRFHPPRRWHFDFAWLEQKLALEVEGGVDARVGHAHPTNFRTDIEKYNRATLDGWRVLRVMPEHLKQEDGRAVFWIEEALKQ